MTQVDDKRTAILEATLRLISKNGFHGTAMSKVAKEAGVSAGIIYHYFESKDALMSELYKAIKRDFGQTLTKQIDQTQPLKQQIRQMLAIIIRYYVHRPLESAFVEQFSRSPYFNSEIELEVSQSYLPLMAAFKKAQEEMIIKNLPAPVVMAFTFDVSTSLAQKHAIGVVTLTDDLIQQVIDASWEAIRQ